MDPLRKLDDYQDDSLDVTYSYGEMHGTAYVHTEAPARTRDDDLRPDQLAQLQADANEFLDGEEWTLIDGV